MSFPTPRNLITPTDVVRNAVASGPARRKSVITAREARLDHPAGRIDAAVASSCGTRHDINEDAHSTLDGSAPVYVVADGVGGGALASRVSQELVARLHGQLDSGPSDADDVRDALLDADHEIARSIATYTEASGAATVALCAAAEGSLSRWWIAWVGDCRIYRLRCDRTLELLSRDDTYRNVDELPPTGGSPHDPARMVGNGAVDAPNVRAIELDAGEMLVLCSDGVHKHVGSAAMARILAAHAAREHDRSMLGEARMGTLARRCARLIEHARADGSHDDATVLVVRRGRRDLSGVARVLMIAGAAAVLTGALGWVVSGYSAPDASASRAASPSVATGAEP